MSVRAALRPVCDVCECASVRVCECQSVAHASPHHRWLFRARCGKPHTRVYSPPHTKHAGFDRDAGSFFLRLQIRSAHRSPARARSPLLCCACAAVPCYREAVGGDALTTMCEPCACGHCLSCSVAASRPHESCRGVHGGHDASPTATVCEGVAALASNVDQVPAIAEPRLAIRPTGARWNGSCARAVCTVGYIPPRGLPLLPLWPGWSSGLQGRSPMTRGGAQRSLGVSPLPYRAESHQPACPAHKQN